MFWSRRRARLNLDLFLEDVALCVEDHLADVRPPEERELPAGWTRGAGDLGRPVYTHTSGRKSSIHPNDDDSPVGWHLELSPDSGRRQYVNDSDAAQRSWTRPVLGTTPSSEQEAKGAETAQETKGDGPAPGAG